MSEEYNLLESAAIDYVLPLKPARRDAIANLKLFWGPRDTNDLISMVSFTFTTRRHPIRLASAQFTTFRLEKFESDLCCV